ncbi:MAG TPA: GntR family transcriptional regulator [Acidimicrobiales bacterium]|nr:GntR family transcriptional regulator [Acidimicrobiales bacterium]
MSTREPAFRSMQRTRLVDDVTRELREMIVSGELAAGTQLLQVDLAERLGVSRTPLREAFRILENDGLVRTSNGNRTIEVVTIDARQLREMYELREVIDGLAARLAARAGISDETEHDLRRLLDDMEASTKPYDPSRRIEAHARFHSLIAEASGNHRVKDFLPLIRVSSAALYLPFINDPSAVALVDEGHLITHKEAMDSAQQGHEAIVDAIVAGNARKAEAAARRHIAGTLRWVDRLDEWREAIAAAQEVDSSAPA